MARNGNISASICLQWLYLGINNGRYIINGVAPIFNGVTLLAV